MYAFDAKKEKDAIVHWIKDYFRNNANETTYAVVGISGGKDSSIVAALCAEALGKDRVYGVLMPQGKQSDIDYSHLLVEHLGIPHTVVNVGSTVDCIIQEVSREGNLKINEQMKVNVPPRIRMTVLYAVSAAIGGRVANTCNLSEDYVGYSTKYGDGAGDFSPLSELTVTEVKAIGHELGLPKECVEKVPLDGLSGKTDEDNLGFTYDVLDQYIRVGLIDCQETKQKIDDRHRVNLHKLQLMPKYAPIFTESYHNQ